MEVGVVGAVQVGGEILVLQAHEGHGVVNGGIGLQGVAHLTVVPLQTVVEHGGDVGPLLIVANGFLFDNRGQGDDLLEGIVAVLYLCQQVAADAVIEVGEHGVYGVHR